jgi:osmotically-inducible protein OsmY
MPVAVGLAAAAIALVSWVPDVHALAPAALPDPELARAVEERLDRDPRLSTFDLEVEARDGVVLLRGRVPTLADLFEARDLAFDVPGVALVDTRIELETRGRPDGDIEFDLRSRFRDNGDLAAATLEVTVRGGAVLLTGTVPDPRLRLLARRVAARVPGVVGVADELRAPEVPDEDVLARVRDVLERTRADGEDGTVTAEVREGVVVLEGRVGSAARRRATAERILALRGVRGVVNRVRVAN